MSEPGSDSTDADAMDPDSVDTDSTATGVTDSSSPAVAPAERPLALPIVAVFAAGALGTGVRLLLDASIPAQPGGVPVSTLAVNTLGSFLLGMVVSVVSHRAPEWLRAGLSTGLLGSFTTFSAVTVASVALAGSDRPLGAVVVLAVSVVAGVGAALAGIAAGRALGRIRS